MRPNVMNDKFTRGEQVVCGQMVTASTVVAECLSTIGFDTIVFDMQHGEIDYSAALNLLFAASASDTMPLVRIPWNDPSIIMKLLDAGAGGLICPMINDREECERFVSAAHFPPRGIRSFGPLRAAYRDDPDYAATANAAVTTLAMIETAAGLAHVEEIMSTPGLSGVYIGPSDLSASLGGPFGPDWTEGPVRSAIDHVRAAGRTHSTMVGIYVDSPEYAADMLALGVDFIVLQSEIGLIQSEARRVLDAFRRPAAPRAADASTA